METETTWTKLPAIEGRFGGCLCCGVRASFFPPDGVIAVGFGYAGLHRDERIAKGRDAALSRRVPLERRVSRQNVTTE
jgi:hypothetical protein